MEIKQNKEYMGDNDDIRPYDELFSPGTVSNTKYLSNGDMEGMEEKELKTKQIIDKLVDDYVACRITYDEFSKEMKSFYADEDESKPILKEFDLEAAKAGKPVCTRDGRKARIICFDAKGDKPIIALVEMGTAETPNNYPIDGKAVSAKEASCDLMMLPEKKEGWVNIYNAGGTYYSKYIYKTEKEATGQADTIFPNHVATVKIEWYE